MCSDCKQQNYRAKVFLYLCPLNFTTPAVFSRGQISTLRFARSLPRLQHPVTHQLTSNPNGRLMRSTSAPVPAMSRVTTRAQLHALKIDPPEVKQAVNDRNARGLSAHSSLPDVFIRCVGPGTSAAAYPYVHDVTVRGYILRSAMSC